MTFLAVTDPLPLTGLVFEGPDARSFLQGQFTNDIALLQPASAGGPARLQLNGYCSPKGRLLGLGWLFQSGEEAFTWLLPAELVAGLEKRLKMFVLRAKVQISTSPSVCRGVIIDSPLDHPAIGEVQAFNQETVLARLATDLGLLLGDPAALSTEAGRCPRLETMAWSRRAVEAGLPIIATSTQDRFVPQMLNLDLIGGVSFTKGCYPGQEVVARSQYLGKLHRRMFGVQCLPYARASEAALNPESPSRPEILPGHGVVFADDPATPVGQVVSLAWGQTADEPALGLLECTLDAWARLNAGEPLLLEGLHGWCLSPRVLPYPVPTEVQQPNRPKL